MTTETTTYRFKKGDRPHLDDVYNILSIIPNETYFQHDIADSNPNDTTEENDSGESILFLKNVTIKVTITI